jgi:hypothetical protein
VTKKKPAGADARKEKEDMHIIEYPTQNLVTYILHRKLPKNWFVISRTQRGERRGRGVCLHHLQVEIAHLVLRDPVLL